MYKFNQKKGYGEFETSFPSIITGMKSHSTHDEIIYLGGSLSLYGDQFQKKLYILSNKELREIATSIDPNKLELIVTQLVELRRIQSLMRGNKLRGRQPANQPIAIGSQNYKHNIAIK